MASAAIFASAARTKSPSPSRVNPTRRSRSPSAPAETSPPKRAFLAPACSALRGTPAGSNIIFEKRGNDPIATPPPSLASADLRFNVFAGSSKEDPANPEALGGARANRHAGPPPVALHPAPDVLPGRGPRVSELREHLRGLAGLGHGEVDPPRSHHDGFGFRAERAAAGGGGGRARHVGILARVDPLDALGGEEHLLDVAVVVPHGVLPVLRVERLDRPGEERPLGGPKDAHAAIDRRLARELVRDLRADGAGQKVQNLGFRRAVGLAHAVLRRRAPRRAGRGQARTRGRAGRAPRRAPGGAGRRRGRRLETERAGDAAPEPLVVVARGGPAERHAERLLQLLLAHRAELVPRQARIRSSRGSRARHARECVPRSPRTRRASPGPSRPRRGGTS